jgi:hypothetical protein
MFGHGEEPDLGVVDFWLGVVGVLGVEGAAEVDGEAFVVAGVVAAVLACVPDDAAALEMPAAAPPVASAPAIMVAPSILEMAIEIEPPGVDWWGVSAIVRACPKRQRTMGVGVL